MGVANDNCCVCGGSANITAAAAANVAAAGGGDATTATTTASPASDLSAVVNPDGTCGGGKGNRGNGICAGGTCCSKVRTRFIPADS